MAEITYATKQNFATLDNVPAAQKVSAADMNEIKSSVNELYSPPTAFFSFYNNSVETVLTENNWVQISIAATSQGLNKFSYTANNILTYTGTDNYTAKVIAAIEFTSPSNNQNIEFAIHKNGVNIDGVAQVNSDSHGHEINVTLPRLIQLETDDVITFHARNTTGSNNIVIGSMAVMI